MLEENFATKADIVTVRADIARMEHPLLTDLRAEIQKGDNALKGEMSTLKGEISTLRNDMEKMETSLRSDMQQMETSIRGDMHKMETSLRSDMEKNCNTLRSEMGVLKVDMIKWMIGLFFGQVALVFTVMKFMH